MILCEERELVLLQLLRSKRWAVHELSGDANVERIFHWMGKENSNVSVQDWTWGLALPESRFLRPVQRKWADVFGWPSAVGTASPSLWCPMPSPCPPPAPARRRSRTEEPLGVWKKDKEIPCGAPMRTHPSSCLSLPCTAPWGPDLLYWVRGLWGDHCMHQANLALANQGQHLPANGLKVAPRFFNATSKSLCPALLHLPQSGMG